MYKYNFLRLYIMYLCMYISTYNYLYIERYIKCIYIYMSIVYIFMKSGKDRPGAKKLTNDRSYDSLIINHRSGWR